MNSITLSAAPDTPIPTGLHCANITRANMQQRANRNGKLFTSLHLEFTDASGARASLMVPDFTGLIPTVFTALGEPFTAEPITGERLLNLRGCNAEIHVSHVLSNGKTYANVLSLNGHQVRK